MFLIISSLVIYQIHMRESAIFQIEDIKIDFDYFKSEANQIDDIEYLREKYLLSLNAYQSVKEALGAGFEAVKWSVYGLTFVTIFNLSTVIIIGYKAAKREREKKKRNS